MNIHLEYAYKSKLMNDIKSGYYNGDKKAYEIYFNRYLKSNDPENFIDFAFNYWGDGKSFGYNKGFAPFNNIVQTYNKWRKEFYDQNGNKSFGLSQKKFARLKNTEFRKDLINYLKPYKTEFMSYMIYEAINKAYLIGGNRETIFINSLKILLRIND